MIYITGDVHSNDFVNWEQKGIGSNAFASIKYLEILKKYKMSCTFFINGISLDREFNEIKKLQEYDVELGGHTYDNFGKIGKVRGFIHRKIFGCVYGSKGMQTRDIRKTIRAFKRRGMEMTSWRTHAFASNEETFRILSREGIRYVSDLTGETLPFEKGGILHIPVNTPVDQNTISYGPLCPENRDPFASCVKGRIRPSEWLDIVKKRVAENEKKGIDSILLLHPATMAFIEDYAVFEDLVKFLSKYKSGKISEYKLKPKKK